MLLIVKNKIATLLFPSGSVSRRAMKGSFWLLLFRIFDQLFGFVKTMVLARLLAPGDFGIFGIAIIAISLLESFSQTGFFQALVQKTGDIKPYLGTAWVVQVLRGITLAVLLFLAAPYVASFFNTPPATLVLQIVSIAVLIRALENSAIVYFSKDLEFHKLFMYQVAGSVADVAVSLGAVFLFQSVWALVLGYLAANVARTVVSYLVCAFKPEWNFSLAKAKELTYFGRWIFAGNIVGFFINQGESVFVGKLLGAVSLGFYQMAYKISSILGIDIVAGAIFPVFSKIQNDRLRLKSAYLKTLQLLAFLFIPAAGGMVIVASDFVSIFLGRQWLPMVASLQMLVVAGVIWSFGTITGRLFQALGKPKTNTMMGFARLVLLLIFVYPAIRYFGITGAALAFLVSSSLAAIWYLIVSFRAMAFSWRDVVAAIGLPLANALVMIAGVFTIKLLVVSNPFSFFLYVVAGAAIYVLSSYLADKIFHGGMRTLLKECFWLLIR